jgi:hypothetical protein
VVVAAIHKRHLHSLTRTRTRDGHAAKAASDDDNLLAKLDSHEGKDNRRCRRRHVVLGGHEQLRIPRGLAREFIGQGRATLWGEPNRTPGRIGESVVETRRTPAGVAWTVGGVAILKDIALARDVKADLAKEAHNLVGSECCFGEYRL